MLGEAAICLPCVFPETKKGKSVADDCVMCCTNFTSMPYRSSRVTSINKEHAGGSSSGLPVISLLSRQMKTISYRDLSHESWNLECSDVSPRPWSVLKALFKVLGLNDDVFGLVINSLALGWPCQFVLEIVCQDTVSCQCLSSNVLPYLRPQSICTTPTHQAMQLRHISRSPATFLTFSKSISIICKSSFTVIIIIIIIISDGIYVTKCNIKASRPR